MKKVLSFVLVLAMVLGCFSTVFAKEFADVAADADSHDAVAVLSDLGVCAGKSETSFDPEGIVNRAEMAAFIINALGITPTANAPTKFTDVEPSKWYSGYVAYANSLGIISGRTATTFDPEAQVSYDEAITMLINALGYTADSLTGTYPAAYVSKAKTLGILEDVDALGTVKCNRGDVAIMLYNTLTCPIGHTDKDGAWAISTPPDTMMIRLVGGNFTDTLVITDTEVDDAVIDISDMLGSYATVYTDKDGNIVAVYELLSETITNDYDDNEFGDYDIATKVTYPLVDGFGNSGYYAFNNGKLTGFVTTPFDFTGRGTVTVVGEFSGNYVKKIYSIMTWNVGDQKKVEDSDLEDLEDAKLLSGKFKTNDKNEIDTTTFQLLGVDKLEDIKENDIVAIYTGGGYITKVEVGTEVITGEVTAKTKAGKVTVDGKTLAVSNLPGANMTVAVESEYDFYLDYNGDVYFADPVDEKTTTTYGVITKLGKSESFYGTKTFGVTMFTEEGKTVEYTVNSKKFADSMIVSNEWTAVVGQVVEYKLNADNEIVAMKAIAGPTGATIINGTSDITAKGAVYVDPTLTFRLTADTVVFVYEGYNGAAFQTNGTFDADKLSVVEASKLFNVEGVMYYALVKDTKAIAVLANVGVSPDDNSVLAFYQDDYTEVADGEFSVKFLVDGKDVTFTNDAEPTELVGGTLYVVTPDKAGGTFTAVAASAIAVDPVAAADTIMEDASMVPGLTVTADCKFSSTSGEKSYLASNGTRYLIADDIQVYQISGHKAAKKTESILTVKTTPTTPKTLVIYDVDGDGEYDLAIVK